MAYENNTGYISVTDALSPYIDKRWFKDIHRQRGEYAHQGMSAYAKALWFAGKRDGWNGYIVSGKRWFDEHIKKVLLVEERLVCHDYRFTGKSDLVAVMNKPWDDLIALIDWKTAVQESKHWKFQTAGYQYLTEKEYNLKIDIRLAVRLRQEGSKACLHNLYDKHDYDKSIMLQFINVYNAIGGV